MLQGARFEDTVKSVVGLVFLGAAVILFGPGLADRYGSTLNFSPASKVDTRFGHEVALHIEADHEKLDVLNIRITEETILMTALDLAPGEWSDEDITNLVLVTFYLVDLAQEEEMSITTIILRETEAVTVDAEEVAIYVHNETLKCPWQVLKDYDGSNQAEIIQGCLVTQGNGLIVDSEDISWPGRGE